MEAAGMSISSPESLSDRTETRSTLLSPLCSSCQDVLTLRAVSRYSLRRRVGKRNLWRRQWASRQAVRRRWRTINSEMMSKSAAGGCRLCSVVLLHCESSGDVEFRLFNHQAEHEVPQSARLHILQNYVGIQELVIESTNAIGFQPPVEILGDFVGEGPSWDHVPRWLEACNNNHPECRKTFHTEPSKSWMPSRLIKVGFHGDGYVRIVSESDGYTMKGAYNTLSHRWGTNDMVQLKHTNIRLFTEEGIPLSHLSQTFQDAVQVTRKLGILYLWIDSLCIIQDSYDDWTFQSSNMHLVYSHSYLNLAASREGIAGQGGLIGPREQINNEWHIWARNGEQDSNLLVQSRDLWEQEVELCPLNGRGWVLQERMLSPRVLYFNRSQLFWECEHFRACEKFPKGLSPLTRPDLGKSLTPMFYEAQYDPFTEDAQVNQTKEQGRSAAMENLWALLLRRYGDCNLTRASDKLVAVAGLARRLSTVIDGRYLAGIWESSLPAGLSWSRDLEVIMIDKGETPRKAISALAREDTYRAPTWSWASTSDGRFHYYIPRDIETLVEIVRCEVTSAGNHDDFGNLESASICIKGDLFGNLFVRSAEKRALCSTGISLSNSFGLDMVSTTVEPDYNPVFTTTELYFLPLYKMHFSQGPAKGGLLLVPATTHQHGARIYQRWGWCTVYADCTEDSEHLSLFDRSQAGAERRDEYRVSYARDIEITLI